MTGLKPPARTRTNGLVVLMADLWRRTYQPFGNFSFIGGMALTVVFGGWAIWIELFALRQQVSHHDIESLQSAMVTFFPAIVGTTYVQLLLDEDCDKRLKTFSVLVLIAALLGALYLTFVPATAVSTRVRILAGACVASIWFWGVANAHSTTFQDEPQATGGDPTADVAGDLGDFKG